MMQAICSRGLRTKRSAPERRSISLNPSGVVLHLQRSELAALSHQSPEHRDAGTAQSIPAKNMAISFSAETVPESACLILWCSKHDSLMIGCSQEQRQRKCDLSQSVEPCGGGRLSPARSTVPTSKCTACSSPLSRGLMNILLYKEHSYDVTT